VFISLLFHPILILLNGLCIFIFISTYAHVVVHTGTSRLRLLVPKDEEGRGDAPIYKRFGSFNNFHYNLPEVRTQDFIICEVMDHNKGAAFQQVDIPTS
jgi:hypothetical protein